MLVYSYKHVISVDIFIDIYSCSYMINDSIPYSLVVRGKALLFNLRQELFPEGIPEGNNLCRGLNKRPIPHTTSEYLLYHTEV